MASIIDDEETITRPSFMAHIWLVRINDINANNEEQVLQT
jgi:hypothetical protein